MRIYIPTIGRVTNQRTLRALPKALRRITTLVTVPEEKDMLKYVWPEHKVLAPKGVKGIAATRQWILEHSKHEIIVMLDDDLKFHVREPGKKFRKATKEEIISNFKLMEKWCLTDVVHCGITPRFWYWEPKFKHVPFLESKRLMYVLCYNRPKVLKAGCSFTEGLPTYAVMEDFHMTLQLLEKGYNNRLLLHFCSTPRLSNSNGGCSTWRTLKRHNNSAHALSKLYPEYVTLRRVSNWRKLEERLDVTVNFLAAYKDSQRKGFFHKRTLEERIHAL